MRLLGFLLFFAFSAAVSADGIDSVRLRADEDRTRIVFDLQETLEYNAFRMRNPDRIVIDFKDTKMPTSLKLPEVEGHPIKGLRYARRAKSGLRVVLDLESRAELQHTLLPPRQAYGHRLVLDLFPEGKPSNAIAAPIKQVNVADKELSPAAVVAEAAVKPVKTAPVKQSPAVKKRPPRDVVIAIDAGHGGNDVGAIGPSGTYEKDIVLQVSRELAKVLNREHGIRAILTRDKDYYLPLRERMLRARDQQADLFVSIHADAFKDSRVRGSSVYVLSQHGASSEAARWLAENENASDLVGGVTLNDKDEILKSVLIDLSQTASIDASIDAAEAVLGALKKLGKVHKPSVQHAGFMVLKSPDIPSLLVETAFISNPKEEKKLKSKNYQKRLAKALTTGIVAYFSDNPPPETRFAQRRKHRVSPGDTLSGIAEQYSVSMESIKLANNLSRDGVRKGEILRIP